MPDVHVSMCHLVLTYQKQSVTISTLIWWVTIKLFSDSVSIGLCQGILTMVTVFRTTKQDLLVHCPEQDRETCNTDGHGRLELQYGHCLHCLSQAVQTFNVAGQSRKTQSERFWKRRRQGGFWGMWGGCAIIQHSSANVLTLPSSQNTKHKKLVVAAAFSVDACSLNTEVFQKRKHNGQSTWWS